MTIAHAEGLGEVVKNLKKARPFAGKGCERGLKRSGALVLRESMKEVPVDTGNLRGSAFVRATGSGFNTSVAVGYTAEYAIFVHEDLDAAHGEEYNRKHAAEIAAARARSGHRPGTEKYKEFARGKGQKAKFLEDPVKRLKGKIIQLVAQGVAEEMEKL